SNALLLHHIVWCTGSRTHSHCKRTAPGSGLTVPRPADVTVPGSAGAACKQLDLKDDVLTDWLAFTSLTVYQIKIKYKQNTNTRTCVFTPQNNARARRTTRKPTCDLNQRRVNYLRGASFPLTHAALRIIFHHPSAKILTDEDLTTSQAPYVHSCYIF
ncbi:hypothetical protein ILYODFUR_027579, partial [Ilyodon furcidens]